MSTPVISQADFASLVNPRNAGGPIAVLSGTHGTRAGNFIPERAFFDQDLARWGGTPGVNVYDVTRLNAAQLQAVLNSPGRIICAWCYSERSIAALRALGHIP